jgi:trehalose 2-sulfotransferase
MAMGAGKPEEYFDLRIHNGRILTLSNRDGFMQPTPQAYIERIKQQNTVNGIFGVKTHYSQLAGRPEIIENLTRIFPDAKYISITRRNILRQAISATRAIQTQAWTSQLSERRTPRFHLLGIVKHLVSTAEETELWEQFYAANGIKPLRILYEELDEDFETTMRQVTAFLGISGEIPPPPTRKQADAITETWVERFIDAFRGIGMITRIVRFLAARW